MKQVKAYKCDFCNMVSFYRSSVARHEKNSCKSNMDRKTCLNCVNYDHEPYESDTGAGHDYCEVLEFDIERYLLNENRDCSAFKMKPTKHTGAKVL